MPADLGEWRPLPVDAVAELLAGPDTPWWIAGGWALDLHLGTLHDIWCRRAPTSPWALQLMVDDTEGDEWVFRRDRRIRRPVAELSGPASTVGRPVLAPEVQLLYKSRGLRAKDVEDFHRVVGSLDRTRRDWLRRALTTVDPRHDWLSSLQPPS